MFKQKKTAISTAALTISVIILTGALVLTGCKKESVEGPNTEKSHNSTTNPVVQTPTETIPGNPKPKPIPPPDESLISKPQPIPTPPPVIEEKPKRSLNDVISKARTWRPAYASWLDKPAPDFIVTDLAGKQHKLSDYRGKNVMLVFWATWCPPCMMEIPHLISLRNSISPEKLAILALTPNNRPELVHNVAQSKKLNYTVAFEQQNMPAPFGVMRIYRTSGVPASFFIRPDGTIKLATSGLLAEDDMRGILEAE
ncbi:MAG: peroxiredoxin family protein [Planctomycetota bacterium]|jgi:peroxiredoxin